MSILINLAKNTIARSTTEIVNRASSAIFWIFITRYLGAAGLGTMALALSLLSVFGMIATLGLGTFVIREISRNKENSEHYFTASLILGGAGTLIALAVMLVLIHIMKYESTAIQACTLISFALIPMSLLYWCRAVLLGHEKMEYIAYARFIENALKVGLGIILLILGHGILMLIALVFLTKAVGALMLFHFVRTRANVRRFSVDYSKIVRLVKNVPIFFSTTLFNSMFWSAPIIIVSKVGGLEEAGIYSAAYKLVDILLCFSAAFGQAVFPILSRLSKKSKDLFRTVCIKSIKFITLFTIAVATGGTLLAEKIVVMVYGKQMLASALPLQILIWSVVPFGLVPLLAYTLISKDLQKYDMISNFSAFVSVWALNITLIIIFGYIGAAVATLTATAIFALSQLYYVNIKLFRTGSLLSVAKLLPPVCIMAGGIILLREINLFVLIIIGSVIYSIVTIAVKTVTLNDRQLFRQLKSL